MHTTAVSLPLHSPLAMQNISLVHKVTAILNYICCRIHRHTKAPIIWADTRMFERLENYCMVVLAVHGGYSTSNSYQ